MAQKKAFSCLAGHLHALRERAELAVLREGRQRVDGLPVGLVGVGLSRKTHHSFLSLSRCLSRACLGKMIAFSCKNGSQGVS